jgi:hypothetical protein
LTRVVLALGEVLVDEGGAGDGEPVESTWRASKGAGRGRRGDPGLQRPLNRVWFSWATGTSVVLPRGIIDSSGVNRAVCRGDNGGDEEMLGCDVRAFKSGARRQSAGGICSVGLTSWFVLIAIRCRL